MNEIKCPNCGQVFKVDESGFADIVKQIRDHEFDQELRERIKNAAELAEAKAKNALKDNLAEKNEEIAALKNKANLAVAQKNTEIAELKAKIAAAETAKQLAVSQAVNKVEKERDTLVGELKSKDTEKQLLEASLKDKYLAELKSKDEMIAYYKDMKAKLSTKMVGETLELHCETQFNQIRATAFPKAYFEKDNDARGGSKGDYIYREVDESGNEIISIMFDMKNEQDETATKKKNEDFLKELDKDRIEKKCEYAVLVSLLEPESELYNSGIVDVSHRYQKMYVIRPQFFIPMITVLRNAALNSLKYKSELALIRNQNIDITTFEADMNHWKSSWLTSMKNAGKKHLEAIEQINNAIKNLEKVRDALAISDKHLLAAENKMDDLSIKRLTRGNPTMTAEFAKLAKTS